MLIKYLVCLCLKIINLGVSTSQLKYFHDQYFKRLYLSLESDQ